MAFKTNSEYEEREEEANNYIVKQKYWSPL